MTTRIYLLGLKIIQNIRLPTGLPYVQGLSFLTILNKKKMSLPCEINSSRYCNASERSCCTRVLMTGKMIAEVIDTVRGFQYPNSISTFPRKRNQIISNKCFNIQNSLSLNVICSSNTDLEFGQFSSLLQCLPLLQLEQRSMRSSSG